MIRRKKLAEFVAKKREQKEEQGREGSNFEESGSRGIREEATEIYSDPVHRVGDLVMILKDTRPGVSFKSSYDKEGRVIEAIDGKGSGPNLYVVKLLHEHGTEKVDELWLREPSATLYQSYYGSQLVYAVGYFFFSIAKSEW